MTLPRNLSGLRFGRLVVLKRSSGGHNSVWLCRCDCGCITDVNRVQLKSGRTRSCGCLNSELSAARLLRHGASRRKRWATEYRAYAHAKDRCNNPKVKSWKDYGGRGIRFLFVSYEEFLADVGSKPLPHAKYSIDRINNNGNYEPGNVRWATRKQQRANRRDSKC